MLKVFRRLHIQQKKNGKLISNYIYNTLYQVLLIVVPLITIPYISRILGVTNIGVFQYAQSVANYFVIIGAVGTTLYGQREIAYLQDKPKERSEAFWEIEIFRILTTIMCSIIYFLVFCTHGRYPDIYSILIIEVIATAFDISWFFMGMEDFKLIIIRNVIIRLVSVVCVFLFVKKLEDLPIYTLCVVAPLIVGNFSLWFSLKNNLVKTGLCMKTLFHGIKERIKPILVLFIPQIAADVYLFLDKTMIGIFGSNIDQVGYYSQGQKIVQIFLRIVTSLGTVMLPTMSFKFSQGDQKGVVESVKKAFRFTYMLSFPLLFGLCAIAHRFVPMFFGVGYDPVIQLMVIISPTLVIIATSNVIGKQYLLPTNQHSSYTISIIIGAGVNLILNVILIHFWDAIGASIATVAAEIAVTTTQCWYVRKQLPLKDCLGYGWRYALYGALMYLIVRGVGLFLPLGKVWALLVMAFVGVAVYGIEIVITRDPILRTLFSRISIVNAQENIYVQAREK